MMRAIPTTWRPGFTLLLLALTVPAAQAQRDFGVDVSHFQGEAGISQSAWNQMFAEGKRFAFIKATEGLTGPDDAAMANNVARATAAGLRVGVYHFAHPENRPLPSGAVQEADHLLSYAGNFIGPGYLRPVLDVEFNAGTLTTAALTDWVIAFSDEIIAHRGPGAAPIIYCSQSFANNEFDTRLAGYDLWLRTVASGANPATDDPPGQGFADATGVFNNWSFWQYDDMGGSGGISPLDLNVCHTEFKSLDSFLIPEPPSYVAPMVTTQPLSQCVTPGADPVFNVAVSVSSSTPLSYQWRFNETNIPGATLPTYTRPDVQASDAGSYTVVITNYGGKATSEVATLTVFSPVALYQEDFDGFASPSVVTGPGTAHGFQILFGPSSSAVDFKAIFGFDYSSVTSPLAIPPAPHSSGGTTRGLYLTVNKDLSAAAAAINLYPVGQTFAGNFSLRFDMWINWINASGSTEHALFGINHSGSVTNRIGQATSDGLFFAVDGDGGVTSTSGELRDYAVFNGGGNGAIPILRSTAASFGPIPPLGAQFDNANPGFASLFPSKGIPGYPAATGSAGLGWVSGEVRQENNLITWLLNDTVVAQYTNTTAFTGGNILVGYNDHFSSIGHTNNFVIFDNIRVETGCPDLDANGLPDAWELQYFGQTGVDPDADPDSEGAGNLQEYLAGTNPTNAASAFRILNAARTNNDLLLDWTTVGGHSYVVQIATNTTGSLTTNFVDLSPLITVGGTNEGSTNYLHLGGATNAGGYYRVRLGP